jgi:hypothetical protein
MLTKMLFVFGVLAGILVLALENPIVVANALWLLYAGAALVSIGTIASTKLSSYNTNTWNPKPVRVSDKSVNIRDVPGSTYVYH